MSKQDMGDAFGPGSRAVGVEPPSGVSPLRASIPIAERVRDLAVFELLELARRISEAPYSHINGRDRLAELHPRSSIDITVRREGRNLSFEGDWLSDLFSAVKKLRAFLAFHGVDAMEREIISLVKEQVPPPLLAQGGVTEGRDASCGSGSGEAASSTRSPTGDAPLPSGLSGETTR